MLNAGLRTLNTRKQEKRSRKREAGRGKQEAEHRKQEAERRTKDAESYKKTSRTANIPTPPTQPFPHAPSNVFTAPPRTLQIVFFPLVLYV